MRILIANSHRSIVGGIEKYLRTVLPALRDQGHEIAALFEHSQGAEFSSIDSSIPDLRIWSSQDLATPGGRTDLEHWSPDVVYLHGLQSADIEGYLAERYPTVLFAHGYFGTCATGRKSHAFPDVRPCSRQFGLGCLALHYPRRCGGLNPSRAIEMFRRESKRNRALPAYRKIAVASRHMYQEYIRNGANPMQLCLLHLPTTDIQPLAVAPSARTRRDNLLMVGRLTDLKGCDYLIRALPIASRLLGRELTLSIAGSGADEDMLARHARASGVKAQFAGWVDAARQRELMQQADLLIVPSLWPEPFGLVGIEAGCVGLPAVGFAVGGIPEWLLAGVSGELAPGDPPTPEGLADAIFRALRDKVHYDALCRGAWEVANKFKLEDHVTELQGVFFSAASLSPFGLEAAPVLERDHA